MNARDELAEVVSKALGDVTGIFDTSEDEDHELADAILAAGYRKPLTIENDKLVIDGGMLLLDVGSCTCTPYGSSHEYHCGLEYLDDLTKPLERAGYSKPRTIETVEEANVLPAESVVRSDAGLIYEKYADEDGREYDYWLLPGEPRAQAATKIDFPATVLYEPQP